MLRAPVSLTRGPRGGRPRWSYLHPKQMEVHRHPARFKVVVAGRRWGKCLAPETRITMADGSIKAVDQVQPGDMLLTLNEDTYAIEARPVTGVAHNGVRETVVVRTASRAIRCTPNHPILVNNAWIDAGDLRPGDLVGVARRTTFGNLRMLDHEVDYLAIWLAEGSGHVVSNATPEIVDILRRSVLGFGEGTRLVASTSKPGVDWYVTTGRGSGDFKRQAPVTRLLKRHGLFGLNSKTKRIPDAIYRLPKSQLARFLNLFIACDGCITRRSKRTWSLEIGLANERLVRQLAELLAKFGIRGQIRHKIHKACGKDGHSFESWTFVASTSDAIFAFATEIGAVSKEAAVDKALQDAARSRGSSNDYLPIAHDAFVEHLKFDLVDQGKYGGHNAIVARGMPEDLRIGLSSWRKQTRTRVSRRRYETLRIHSDGFFDPVADGDLVWEEVLSVEPAAQVETFDLCMEGNHNFFADGICTHNSQLAKIEIATRAAEKPRQLIWYIAPTYQMARQIMWQELIDVIPKRWLARPPNETMMTIQLKNRTIIQLKGADKPDTLRGVGLHFVVLDEFQGMRRETWDTVIRPTLASTMGEAMFIGTPMSFNHLYDIYMLGLSQKEPDWMSWQFKTITSPFILPEEIDKARSVMSEKEFRQEFEASFETMSNRVYHAFDRTKHVKPVKFDPRRPIIIGMDFNIDPMSAVFMQRHDDTLKVFGERSLTNSNTFEMSQELDRLLWRNKKQIVIYPDPAGAGRSTSSRGESDLSVLRQAGFKRLKYRRKHPKVRDRVNAVNRMLEAADGRVRMEIDPSCKTLISSLEQTQFKVGSNEIDKKLGTEHMSDALGYPVELEFPVRNIRVMGASF